MNSRTNCRESQAATDTARATATDALPAERDVQSHLPDHAASPVFPSLAATADRPH